MRDFFFFFFLHLAGEGFRTFIILLQTDKRVFSLSTVFNGTDRSVGQWAEGCVKQTTDSNPSAFERYWFPLCCWQVRNWCSNWTQTKSYRYCIKGELWCFSHFTSNSCALPNKKEPGGDIEMFLCEWVQLLNFNSGFHLLFLVLWQLML